MKFNCLLAVFLVASLPTSYCQLTAATISPIGTFQARLDPRTNTIFNCIVRGADALVWRIDGIPAEDERIRNRGISMDDVNTGIDNTLQGSITIPNTMVNNPSSVVCVAMNIPGTEPPEISSDPGVLQLFIESDNSINSVTPTDNFGLTDFRTESNSMAMSSSIGSVTIIALCISIIILSCRVLFA